MTDTTEKKELTEEEQHDLEAQEAEQGLDAGFDAVRKGTTQNPAKQEPAPSDSAAATDTGAAPEDEGADADKKADAAAKPAAPAKDPWEGVAPAVRERLDAFGGRMRNIEGHIGGLNSKLDAALESAKSTTERRGGEAPSDARISAALKNPKKWEQLLEDFPDFAAPVQEELQDIRAALAARSPAIDEKKLRAGIKTELSSELRLEMASDLVDERHENWRENVKSPEFGAWLESQSQATKSLANSPRARDAIKLLDEWQAYSDAASQEAAEKGAHKEREEAERLRKQERLESGVTPKGGAQTGGAAALNDEEGLAIGFKRVAGGSK